MLLFGQCGGLVLSSVGSGSNLLNWPKPAVVVINACKICDARVLQISTASPLLGLSIVAYIGGFFFFFLI